MTSGDPTFAEATAVLTVDGPPGRYRAEVAPGWSIRGNAHGGFLLAVAARAALAETGRTTPVTITGHFTAPGQLGPLDVHVDVVKRGRRLDTATVAVDRPDGRRCLTVLTALGDDDVLDPAGQPERVELDPVDIPDPDDCVVVEPGPTGFPPELVAKVQMRLHPDDVGFALGQPSGEPRVRGWFRLREGEPAEQVALLLACDAFPPTLFNSGLPMGWMPTVELTAHLRAIAADGWLRLDTTTRVIRSGLAEIDAVLWDEHEQVVLQSRQLAMVPRPAA